jgi:hypothetical protein
LGAARSTKNQVANDINGSNSNLGRLSVGEDVDDEYSEPEFSTVKRKETDMPTPLHISHPNLSHNLFSTPRPLKESPQRKRSVQSRPRLSSSTFKRQPLHERKSMSESTSHGTESSSLESFPNLIPFSEWKELFPMPPMSSYQPVRRVAKKQTTQKEDYFPELEKQISNVSLSAEVKASVATVKRHYPQPAATSSSSNSSVECILSALQSSPVGRSELSKTGDPVKGKVQAAANPEVINTASRTQSQDSGYSDANQGAKIWSPLVLSSHQTSFFDADSTPQISPLRLTRTSLPILSLQHQSEPNNASPTKAMVQRPETPPPEPSEPVSTAKSATQAATTTPQKPTVTFQTPTLSPGFADSPQGPVRVEQHLPRKGSLNFSKCCSRKPSLSPPLSRETGG